ncbi:MAG: tRNA (5-methylaminomethyl-2-thiouridine)(34)-methyltransferase MnmD [Flavobacterium sp.]
MKREIIKTADGSVTIHIPEMQESYHSKFGAIQEAQHVYIQNGLALFEGSDINILECGFGTGLNAFITFLEAQKTGQQINYTGVEAYPVSEEEVVQLNYVDELNARDYAEFFVKMHGAPWQTEVKVSANFTLTKKKMHFQKIDDVGMYDLVYYDAFGYHAQPELWGEEIFRKMYTALKPNGILITYACRTVIKKAMEAAGFSVKKLPGPPGKREILQATKY